ncbi:cytochrome P450 [Haliea sp. E1-2-M8]|uniref:cytochrome P450 n=1 Tax=Haliea sp. E1-2-M8 TaxID=3064706 RepID=UPI002726F0AE|nr:cytochrome P450 [Haliea sp. E1-2-M8]MDO8862988.1 cytochrome P450 [Haliea sp. E1-2-M8]
MRRHYRTFGVGPHFCLGVHLARLELQIAFEELLASLTDFELVEPPVHAVSMFNDGFKRMPIRFRRKRR